MAAVLMQSFPRVWNQMFSLCLCAALNVRSVVVSAETPPLVLHLGEGGLCGSPSGPRVPRGEPCMLRVDSSPMSLLCAYHCVGPLCDFPLTCEGCC